MLEASSIANMATGTALPGLAHVLSQPLGRLHLSHGLATGIMLPYAMEFNLPVAAHKMAPVARLLGERATTASSPSRCSSGSGSSWTTSASRPRSIPAS